MNQLEYTAHAQCFCVQAVGKTVLGCFIYTFYLMFETGLLILRINNRAQTVLKLLILC